MPHPDPDTTDLEALARLLLDQLGIDRAELRPPRPAVPTLNEYLPRVVAAAGPGARKAYGSYWNHMIVTWGTRRLDQITATDIEQLTHRLAAGARVRRNTRGGRSAREHLIAAARAVYIRAIADNLLPAHAGPAHRVAKPRRLPNRRRALTPDELTQINTIARATGTDPALDALLLRLHTETACRRGGALGLRMMDLDTDECLLRLREKGGTLRWQPISPLLARALRDHAENRGARRPGTDLLRYRDGHPLTYRRYDQLWARIGHRLPWGAAQGVSTHWHPDLGRTQLRLRHRPRLRRAHDTTGAATTTYIKADLQAVATALAAMTGQPHPLAYLYCSA